MSVAEYAAVVFIVPAAMRYRAPKAGHTRLSTTTLLSVFFGRSRSNRKHEYRDRVFESCPWNLERQSGTFCYECHEELLHNPVFTKIDIERFASLVRRRGLNEDEKTASREKLGGRIQLLHAVIAGGLNSLEEMPRRS